MTQKKTGTPAERVIQAAGGTLELAALLGIHRSRTYRWSQPRENGGTGGNIPPKHHRNILEISKEKNWGIEAEDLLFDFREFTF